MAIEVVDGFEPIEIDEDEGQLLGRLQIGQRRGGLLIELTSIAETRQRILTREPVSNRFRCCARGDCLA